MCWFLHDSFNIIIMCVVVKFKFQPNISFVLINRHIAKSCCVCDSEMICRHFQSVLAFCGIIAGVLGWFSLYFVDWIILCFVHLLNRAFERFCIERFFEIPSKFKLNRNFFIFIPFFFDFCIFTIDNNKILEHREYLLLQTSSLTLYQFSVSFFKMETDLSHRNVDSSDEQTGQTTLSNDKYFAKA